LKTDEMLIAKDLRFANMLQLFRIFCLW